jgi:CheY-like chemotaxis protein
MAHILVIDDDPSVLSLFGQFLQREGHSVERACNGKEGLEAVRKSRPDLIITDIMMPEIDGIEVLKTVRVLYPKMPVISISGGTRNLSVNVLQHAQCFETERALEKPVSLVTLREAVQELLGAAPGG